MTQLIPIPDALLRDLSAPAKQRRGFAVMAPERQREIASKGGRYAHWKGTAHEYTSDEAREAGRKGGLASAAARRAKLGLTTPMGASPSDALR